MHPTTKVKTMGQYIDGAGVTYRPDLTYKFTVVHVGTKIKVFKKLLLNAF
jgi:hypothetical protein